jgi:AraC-like DNA-binding protein/quercetin dioxygenase-like cupin family protein
LKALFEQIAIEEGHSFLVRRFSFEYFNAPLHYHPEYELTYILNGYGKRFVGDSVEDFESGDLVLVGSNLPHFWRSDSDFYEQKGLISEAIVIQFSVEFVERIIKNLPELQNIYGLLKKSEVGLKFSHNDLIVSQLEELALSKNIIQLLLILNDLSQNPYQNLSIENIKPDEAENERMKRILEFTLEHFTEEISIQQIAAIAHLTVPSFCRYFKHRTRKTYIDYLNELRVSHARKLLINSELSISQVGFESGFQNLSHFHRVFKKTVDSTPLAYRQRFLNG